MVYVFFGADDFSRQGRLDELKAQWDDEGSLVLNTTILEAQQLLFPDLMNACETVPFLGRNRLVVVEGLLGRFEPREGGGRSRLDEWQGLADYTAKMPATTLLVLIDAKVSRNNPLLKVLRPISKVQEFPAIKGARLQQWIQSRVSQSGATVSPQAARLLAEVAGENLWVLAHEIEKLCLYARGRRIEDGDVREVTSYAREANVFAMIDAIVEKRVSMAMQLMHQLLAEGMTPPHVLFMLTRQLRLMVQARELNTQGLPAAQKQKMLGLSPNYPIDRLFRQSAGYPMPRLSHIYQKLLETDIAIKTGKWKDRLALDLLVAEVCS